MKNLGIWAGTKEANFTYKMHEMKKNERISGVEDKLNKMLNLKCSQHKTSRKSEEL